MDNNSLEMELNRARENLQTEIATGRPAAAYQLQVNRAAEDLYSIIAEGLEANETIEIWAEKSNGQILRIGRIGPLHGTRFPFVSFRHLSHDDAPELFHDCELVVISEFSVHDA